MKRLAWYACLIAALATATPLAAQPLTGGLLGRGSSYTSFVPPTGCASGLVPYFDASLKMVCSPTVYAPTTDTTTLGTVAAKNVTVSALATPTVTSVTPTLTKIGSITTVAGASLVDGDYFTIKYASGLTVPIEFDATPGNGTTGGRVPYVFAPGDTADQIRDGLIVLLNAAAPTQLTAVSGGAATVSISLNTPGAAGDTNTENVANAGFAVTGFANPTAATTYGYKAVSYLADGTSTAASTEVTTAAGHATLSASNFNTVVFAPSAGSVSTRLYRTTGGAAPPKLLYTGTATSYVDVGAAGTAQTPATSNGTGRVLVGDGSAAAPSVAFVSAPTHGIAYVNSALSLFNGGVISGWAGTAGSWYVGIGGLYINGANVIAPLTAPAAATLQLGAAASATPVGQRIRSQGAATGTDIAGADFSISPGPMTGTGATYAAGRYGTLRLGAYAQGTTGTTTSTTTSDRIVLPSRQVTLTGGSATNIVHIDIPALAGASWNIAYSVQVTDSAAPVQMKVLGGRYYGSAYRLAAGNAVPNAVTETGDNEVHSVGGAATDVMTFTGDATGVMVAHNITVGTGLTAPNTLLGTYIVTVGGTGAVTVTPQ